MTIKPHVFIGQLMLGIYDEDGHLLREVSGPQQVRIYWPLGENLERYVTEMVTAAQEQLRATEPPLAPASSGEFPDQANTHTRSSPPDHP